MSYFSKVTVGLKECNAKDNLFKTVDPNVAITRINGYIYYDFDWIKWYIDGCDSIVELMSYLEYLGREHYALLRVGEESDDIDRLGNPYDFHMDIHTNIVHPPEVKFNKGEYSEQ